MVVSQPLVKIKAHAGVVDGVYLLVHQLLHMSMEQLGRETNRIAGNGGLALEKGLAGRGSGEYGSEAQLCKKGVPEGGHFPQIQPQRQANPNFPAPLHRFQPLHIGLLKLVDVQIFLGFLLGDGPLTAVAADVADAAGKGVHRQAAVVAAPLADDALHLVLEMLQRLRPQERTALSLRRP